VSSPHLFVSLFCYPLSKEAQAKGTDEQRLARLQVELGLKAKWPGFRTLYHARTLGEVNLHLDCSTLIAKARSAAASAFLADRAADVWLSIDDDAEADGRTLQIAIEACRAGSHFVVLPQVNGYAEANGTRSINVRFLDDGRPPEDVEVFRCSRGDTRLAEIAFGGCSLMVASREAIDWMVGAYPELACPKSERPLHALFLETVRDGAWIGEDASFFYRAREAGLVPKVMIDCETKHAGMLLPYSWFDEQRKAGSSSGDAAPPADA
jgi:hypothetical protein